MADSTRSSASSSNQPPTAQASAADASTAAPLVPSTETPQLPKEQRLHHRDGRVRVVSTPAELVAAEFDGFAKKAPEDLVFGTKAEDEQTPTT